MANVSPIHKNGPIHMAEKWIMSALFMKMANVSPIHRNG